MSFWQTRHSVLSLLVLGRRKTETLGGLGRVSSVLVSSGLGPDLDKSRHYELNLMNFMMIAIMMMIKLDRVGPFDNRPSTNKLHHFVRKKERKKSDMWHVTRDTWYVTRDTWHMTRDTFRGVNILTKYQLPSSYHLWFMIFWRSGGKGWIAELII